MASDSRKAARPFRFPADPLDLALIAIDGLPEAFRPDLGALILDEAPLSGCGLVLLDHPGLEVGAVCVVKVGRMDPLPAKIVWKKEIESKLVRVGLQYLE